MKEKITFKALQAVIKVAATDYGACSVEAARFLFGKKKVATGKVQLMKNGIEVSEYINADGSSRPSVRDELNITDDVKLIGHVGNISQTKNQVFILKILRKLLDDGQKVVVVLVGDGPLRKRVEDEAEKLGVHTCVRFLGVRADVPRLMKAFDVFLFPSLYEGFGLVALEAQCAGTPCVTSDSVSRSTDIGLGLISYTSLDEDLDTWSKEIKKAFASQRPNNEMIVHNVSKFGYNIRENVPGWLSLYGVT